MTESLENFTVKSQSVELSVMKIEISIFSRSIKNDAHGSKHHSEAFGSLFEGGLIWWKDVGEPPLTAQKFLDTVSFASKPLIDILSSI